MYKESLHKLERYTNVFLMHTQIFLDLNIYDRNPQIYLSKKKFNFHQKYLCDVTFIYKVLNLHLQTACCM